MADKHTTGTLADPRPAVSAAELSALSEHFGEADAGREARLAACQEYLDTPLPDRVYHLWRFTDPTGLLPGSMGARVLAGSDVTPTDRPPVEGAAVTVDLWPGSTPIVQFAEGTALETLSIGTLAQGTGPGERSGAGPDRSLLFTLLNRAAWNSGLAVEVAAGAVLAGPVHVRVHAAGATVLPRISLRAGARSEVTLVEEHLGGARDTVVNSRSDVQAGPGSKVRHVVLQTWEAAARGYLRIRSQAESDADLMTVFGSFGGDRVKVEMTTDLTGSGARSEMIGVALGAGAQRVDLHTGHNHLGGNTWSNIDFKAVVGGKARSSYTGLIRIDEKARVTEAYQTNRNLLLSGTARADAIPELEILNEEVSCSHGATVAPVDSDQLFYLQSRGLDKQEALALVVRGFLEKTLRSLPEALRPAVEDVVEQRLALLEEEA